MSPTRKSTWLDLNQQSHRPKRRGLAYFPTGSWGVQWVLPPLRLGSQPSASLFGFTHHVTDMELTWIGHPPSRGTFPQIRFELIDNQDHPTRIFSCIANIL